MFNAGTVCTGRVLGSALITIEPGGEQVVNGPHWYSYRRLAEGQDRGQAQQFRERCIYPLTRHSDMT